jgi:hypothetical protein
VWELLVPVEKEFYTPEARLLWLELEAPFYVLRRFRGRFEGRGRAVAGWRFAVADFAGYFVGGNSWVCRVSFLEHGVLQCQKSVPLPPGHVLIMSMSSGVALYTAATPL